MENTKNLITNVKVLYWNHDNDYAFRSNKLIQDSEDTEKFNLSTNEDNWTVVSNQDNLEITDKSHKQICETMFSVHNDISSEELVNCLGSKAIFVQEDKVNGNIDHTSMSKSDIVVITEGNEDYYYVCTSWKFKLLAIVPNDDIVMQAYEIYKKYEFANTTTECDFYWNAFNSYSKEIREAAKELRKTYAVENNIF